MIFVGFDPDLHYPSFGVVQVFSDLSFSIIDYGCGDINRRTTGYEAVSECLVQIQDSASQVIRSIYNSGDSEAQVICEAMTVRPRQREAVNGLLKLQVVGGAFASSLLAQAPAGMFSLPKFVDPLSWKGQVPKEVHQRRILRKFGIDRADLKLPEKYAKHVVDALGIAIWAAGQHAKPSSVSLHPRCC